MNINSNVEANAAYGLVGTAGPSQARRRTVGRMLGAGLAGWLTAMTLGTSSATAATVSNLWSPGAVTYYQATNYTAQVFKTGALYPTPTAALWVPGPVVGRSAARATYQTVKSTTYIQQWNGASWVVVGTPWTLTKALAPGSGAASFATTQLATGPGYFKVVTQIVWSDQYGLLGSKAINYTHASDYRCSVSFCQIGEGYIRIA